MSTHSTDGRPWARLSELKAGDKLVADGGFTCIKKGGVVVVEARGDGQLYVGCRSGSHYLDGQVSGENHDSLIGLWRSP